MLIFHLAGGRRHERVFIPVSQIKHAIEKFYTDSSGVDSSIVQITLYQGDKFYVSDPDRDVLDSIVRNDAWGHV